MSARHRIPPQSWWVAAVNAMRRVEPVPGPRAALPGAVIPAQRAEPEIYVHDEHDDDALRATMRDAVTNAYGGN